MILDLGVIVNQHHCFSRALLYNVPFFLWLTNEKLDDGIATDTAAAGNEGYFALRKWHILDWRHGTVEDGGVCC